MRAADLMQRLEDAPFKPFRIHLSDQTTIDVTRPRMIVVGRSTAILPTEFELDEDGHRIARHWRTVALVHIVQFSDLDERVNGKRRRRSR
jgi:hypothetical protein